MVDGDALEMRFGETQRGFESPPLRLKEFSLARTTTLSCFFGIIYFLKVPIKIK